MYKIKTNPVWKVETEKFLKEAEISTHHRNLLDRLKISQKDGSTYRAIRLRLEECNRLDIVYRFREYASKVASQNRNTGRIPLKSIMTENSSFNRGHLKNRLLKEELIENKCNECNLAPIWNNKPLIMQLDHINGIKNDNRKENIRFLCPNCHSQIETYCGRNISSSSNR